MLTELYLTCDKCGVMSRVDFNGTDPDGWLRHPELGDYCEPCKEVVLA